LFILIDAVEVAGEKPALQAGDLDLAPAAVTLLKLAKNAGLREQDDWARLIGVFMNGTHLPVMTSVRRPLSKLRCTQPVSPSMSRICNHSSYSSITSTGQPRRK